MIVGPRRSRLPRFDLLISRWRLWPQFRLILPVAVRSKRFLAPLLVLSLGISYIRIEASAARHALASRPAARSSRALYRCAPAKARKAEVRGDGQAVERTVDSRDGSSDRLGGWRRSSRCQSSDAEMFG